jgi:hypothetical protein
MLAASCGGNIATPRVGTSSTPSASASAPSWVIVGPSPSVSASVSPSASQPTPSPFPPVASTSSATPRLGPAVGFDGSRVVMLGGAPSGACAILKDAWSWSGSTWQRIAGALPFDAYHSALAYLPDAKQAVLYGREQKTWIWDGKTWSLASATGPTESYGGECTDAPSQVLGLVYSASMQRVLLVGLLSWRDQPAAYEIWSWDGSRWAKLWPRAGQNPNGPPWKLGPAVAWDPVSRRLILFGGIRPLGPDYARNDTWAWDGTNWAKLSPTHVPPTNSGGQAIALDSTTGHLLMLDGAETWTWDGLDWSKLAGVLPGPTPNIDGGALATDPINHQVVYVGGCTEGCAQPYDGTLVWDGKSWSHH